MVTTIGQVDNAGAERFAKLQAWAANESVRLPHLMFPPGTYLMPQGEEKLARVRGELAALPTLADILGTVAAYDEGEQRKDVRVPLSSLRMSEAGGLYGKGEDPTKAIGYTSTGLRHLAALVPVGAQGWGGVLEALPDHLRAAPFNWAASQVGGEDRSLLLRTRLHAPAGVDGPPRRIVDCVGSAGPHGYTGVSDSQLMAAALKGLPDGAKVRYTREPDHSVVEIIWPCTGRQIRVGDLLWTGVRLSNSQTKDSAVVSDRILALGVCRNLTIAEGKDGKAQVYHRHSGNVFGLVREVTAGIREQVQSLEPLLLAFSDAYANKLPATLATRGEVVERLVKMGEVPKQLGQGVVDVWTSTGGDGAGDTLGGLANALTHAAQDLAMDAAEVLQRLSGRVVLDGWAALGV